MKNKILNCFKNPSYIIVYMLSKFGKIFRFMSDKEFLRLKYYLIFRKKLNFENPQTFNEKIQWLKLYDIKDNYSNMVDKYDVKNYVKEIIGEEYIIPTYGIYDRFEDIDIGCLPKQFIIKCTHLGGGTGVVICKDKDQFDIKKYKKQFNKLLKKNLFWHGRERPYKNIKPRIIIEKLLNGPNNKAIEDYKFFCFNGKVQFLKVDYNRFENHQANYYNTNLEIQPFGESAYPPNFEHTIVFPKKIKEMIKLAEKLSQGFKFLRIDLYNVNEKIYFSEITFYPASGFGKINPPEWDKKLGDLIIID